MPAILIFVVLLLAACGDPGASPGRPPGPPPGSSVDVVRVLDGDSLEATIDGEGIEIRLLGVNAPERGECWSDEARDALWGLVGTSGVSFEETGTDRFGRALGYLAAGGRSVNLALIEMGAALALDDGHPRVDEYLAAETEAVAAGRGWWAPNACGPPSGALVEVAAVVADPAGPDEDHLDEEYVVLENRGAAAADLSGWTLRDESSSNRYRFPGGTAVPAGGRLTVRTGCDPGGGLAWCAGGPVWSNGGDTVLLLDASGNVVARRRYPGND